MIPYIQKYIITGAPGTGKTALISALEREWDCSCIHEVSRRIIKDEQEKGGTGMPWQDLTRFASLVFEVSIAELTAKPHALFTDRSMLDLIAYLQVEGKSIPSSIDCFPYHEKFRKKVFFAPTWQGIYQKDEQRPQQFDYCVELEKALEVTYLEKGFDIIMLPKESVSNRVIFVQTFLE